MNLARRKLKMRGARVGREFNDGAAFGERDGQSFGRKQMTAGAAGCKQRQRRGVVLRHTRLPAPASSADGAVSMAARGCSRVSASSMPMA